MAPGADTTAPSLWPTDMELDLQAAPWEERPPVWPHAAGGLIHLTLKHQDYLVYFAFWPSNKYYLLLTLISVSKVG